MQAGLPARHRASSSELLLRPTAPLSSAADPGLHRKHTHTHTHTHHPSTPPCSGAAARGGVQAHCRLPILQPMMGARASSTDDGSEGNGEHTTTRYTCPCNPSAEPESERVAPGTNFICLQQASDGGCHGQPCKVHQSVSHGQGRHVSERAKCRREEQSARGAWRQVSRVDNCLWVARWTR